MGGCDLGSSEIGPHVDAYRSNYPSRPEIPIFIQPPVDYRTRCSTVLLIDRSQHIYVAELSHDDGCRPSHVPGLRRFFLPVSLGVSSLQAPTLEVVQDTSVRCKWSRL